MLSITAYCCDDVITVSIVCCDWCRENVSWIVSNSSAPPDPEDMEYQVCENIPAGIHVDVMYAWAGEHNGTKISTIVGSRIR